NNIEASVSNATLPATDGITLHAEEGATITTTSVAASLAAGFSSDIGAGISGAGAEATNSIRSSTKAFALDSVLSAPGDVVIDAGATGPTPAGVAGVGGGVGGGRRAGLGVSGGPGVARTLTGYRSNAPDSPVEDAAEVMAYAQNSSITAGTLTLSATDTATIDAGVGAGSAAVAVGGTRGGGAPRRGGAGGENNSPTRDGPPRSDQGHAARGARPR